MKSRPKDQTEWTRRDFVAHVSALGAASFLRLPFAEAAEFAPETTKVRLSPAGVICTAPMRLAEELLRLEGFTEVQYVSSQTELGPNLVAAGRADFTQWDVAGLIPMLETDPLPKSSPPAGLF